MLIIVYELNAIFGNPSEVEGVKFSDFMVLPDISGIVKDFMVSKADELQICILTTDMMLVAKDDEKIAIANIIPQGNVDSSQLCEFLVYMDLPEMPFDAGFYRLRLEFNHKNPSAAKALILRESGLLVRGADYYLVDMFSPVSGSKEVPAKKLPIFETFNKTNRSYAIGGTHANGQGFVVVIDF